MFIIAAILAASLTTTAAPLAPLAAAFAPVGILSTAKAAPAATPAPAPAAASIGAQE